MGGTLTVVLAYAGIALSWGGTWVVAKAAVGQVPPIALSAVRRFGAGIGAMSSYMVPVAALLLAFVFLGERPQPLQLAGGAVILAGVRIATLGVRPGAAIEAAA